MKSFSSIINYKYMAVRITLLQLRSIRKGREVYIDVVNVAISSNPTT
jgi:hypothetical protein